MDLREIVKWLPGIGPKLLEIFEVFPRYRWHERAVLLLALAFCAYILWTFLKGRFTWTSLKGPYKTFLRYPWYGKLFVIAAIPLLAWAGYLVTIGEPSVWELEVVPWSSGRTSEGYMRLELHLSNLTKERKVHNVAGTFWIFGVKLVQQSVAPLSAVNLVGKPRSEYAISIPLLQKSSDVPLVEWLVVPPKLGDTGAIGWSFVSSETPWKGGSVMIVNDANGPHLQAAKGG
jgi:hypothetical protein